jgi:hypothetical protein
MGEDFAMIEEGLLPNGKEAIDDISVKYFVGLDLGLAGALFP